MARPLSSGNEPDESDVLASEVWVPPAAVPALVPVTVLPVDAELPDPPVPLPPEPVPFGLLAVQNRVSVVWPAGPIGCGFNDGETQAGPAPGVSAKAGVEL